MHLLNTGTARPNEILAVTFTNKAAREMKERVGRMLGEAVEGMPWLGTFHSICVKLLRRHAELIGENSRPGSNKAVREPIIEVGDRDPYDQGSTPAPNVTYAERTPSDSLHLRSNFTILDTDDQLRLLKQLVAAAGIDDKRWPARALASVIDNWKNRAWTPDNVPASEAGAYDGKAVASLQALPDDVFWN